MIERHLWRKRWLQSLHEFGDGDLQRRTWLDPENRNPHWSYVEFMCSYLGDILYGNDYEWAVSQELITHEEAKAVERLHQLLSRYEAPDGKSYDNARVLSDPAWLEIVDEAQRTRTALAAGLVDPEERRILLEAD